MSVKNLIDEVIIEIGLAGEEGITLETFWNFVSEFRLKPDEVDPIFSTLANAAAPGSSAELPPPRPDPSNGAAEPLTEAYKLWVWPHFLAVSGVSLQQLIEAEPNKFQERPDLKSIRYSEFGDELHRTLRVTVESPIRDKLLFGKAVTLPSIHKAIIVAVAKTREGGIPQPLLSRMFKKEPKALNPIIKKLICCGIIVRVPAVFEKTFTYNVLHLHFSLRNEIYSLCTKAAPPNMKHAAIKTPSASGLSITLTMSLSKSALSKALEQCKDNFLPYPALASTLGITYNNSRPRRRFRRLVTSLVNQGYVARSNAVDPITKRPVRGLRLLKPFRSNANTSAPAAQAVVGSIEYGVPMEHQIYSKIAAAGDTGITSIDLRRQLYDMDRKIFEAYTDKLLNKANEGADHLISFVWEFKGKLRFHRFFTREAFERLNFSGFPTAPEAKVDPQLDEPDLVRSAPSLTGAAREEALLNLVHSRGAVVVTPELNKVLGDAIGSGHRIDRKTLYRSVDKLVAEDRLLKLLVKVKRLDGIISMFPVLVDHALGLDHPKVTGFVSQLREETCLKLRTLTPTTYRDSSYYEDANQNANSKAKNTISQLLAFDENGSAPPNAATDADSNLSSEPEETPALVSQQRQGLIRSRLASLKLLHLGLLEIIAGSSNSLHKQRTVSAHDIFSLLSLECFLSIVPMRKTSDEMAEFFSVQENMSSPVGNVPASIHRYIFNLKNGYMRLLLTLLQVLSAMGLVIPISKECLDDSGVVHLPKLPIDCDSKSLSHYYHLPELFDLRRLLVLDQQFVSIQTYSLSTPSAAAMMWLNLQIIVTTHTDTLHPHYENPELAATMRIMTNSRCWTINYLYTAEQRSLMDSYITSQASSDPANDSALCQRLARQFKMWPFQIRSYFLQSTQKSKHQYLLSQRRKARFTQLNDPATPVNSKRQRRSRPSKPPVAKPKATRRRLPCSTASDNELLHMYAIVKFRSQDGNMSWIDINRELNGDGPDSQRRRVVTLLRYTKGQNRVAALITKWRGIYVKGIASGELQEKSICPITNKATVLTPLNPNPLDPTSYLPPSLPPSGFNLREQLDYFIDHFDYVPPPPQTSTFRLPPSPAEVYNHYQVTSFKGSGMFNTTNVLFHLPPSTAIPLPAHGAALVPNSELVSFYEDLYPDHFSSEVAFLDLPRSQSFTTRFCNLSLDSPPVHLPQDCAVEVSKVALKMILLAPKSTANAILSTSFYSQFSHHAAACAAEALENSACITKERLKKAHSAGTIRTALDIASGYSASNYRPTDKLITTLLGVSPFHLFLLARLSHKELLRLTSATSPPVSPFIGPGGVMALLSKLSSFEIDLEPAHVPEANDLAPTRKSTRSRLLDTAFRHDFNVHVRLLDAPLCQTYADLPPLTGPASQAAMPSNEDLFNLIDNQGPAGLPVVQILDHFPQFEEALHRLVSAQPPLIYRVGMDVCRFVSKNHYKEWMVCIQPSVFDDDLNASDALMVVPHPWTAFNGTENERVLTMCANAALSHIVKSPGISLASLLLRLQPLLNRNDIYFLIEYLKEGNCIYSRHFVQPTKVGPFSGRESYREVPPPRWGNIPHHARGVTCYWPKPHFYLQRPDLSIISELPRNRTGAAPEINPFLYVPEEGVPPIFSDPHNNV